MYCVPQTTKGGSRQAHADPRDGTRGILEGALETLLPRVHCYFDDTLGFTFGDCNGERLAIMEFNARHEMRKLSPIYGLKYYVTEPWTHEMWVDRFWLVHIFDHPLYARRDNLVKHYSLVLDAD
jgi:hypothetical protein